MLAPPCIRQRPLDMAGDLQGAPLRHNAPHRGALLGSPEGLLFLSFPLRFASGSSIEFFPAPGTPRATVADGANNCLSAFVDVDVFDQHFLTCTISMPPESFC